MSLGCRRNRMNRFPGCQSHTSPVGRLSRTSRSLAVGLRMKTAAVGHRVLKTGSMIHRSHPDRTKTAVVYLRIAVDRMSQSPGCPNRMNRYFHQSQTAAAGLNRRSQIPDFLQILRIGWTSRYHSLPDHLGCCCCRPSVGPVQRRP